MIQVKKRVVRSSGSAIANDLERKDTTQVNSAYKKVEGKNFISQTNATKHSADVGLANKEITSRAYSLPQDYDEDGLDADLEGMTDDMDLYSDYPVSTTFINKAEERNESYKKTKEKFSKLTEQWNVAKATVLQKCIENAKTDLKSRDALKDEIKKYGTALRNTLVESSKCDFALTIHIFAHYLSELNRIAEQIKTVPFAQEVTASLIRSLSEAMALFSYEQRKACLVSAYQAKDRRDQLQACSEGLDKKMLGALHAAMAFKEFQMELADLMAVSACPAAGRDDDKTSSTGKSIVEGDGRPLQKSLSKFDLQFFEGLTTDVTEEHDSGPIVESTSSTVSETVQDNDLPQNFFLLDAFGTLPVVTKAPVGITIPEYPSLDSPDELDKSFVTPVVPDRSTKPQYLLTEDGSSEATTKPTKVTGEEIDKSKINPVNVPQPIPDVVTPEPDQHQKILNDMRQRLKAAKDDEEKEKFAQYMEKVVQVDDDKLIDNMKHIADNKTTQDVKNKRIGAWAGLRGMTEEIVSPDQQPKEVLAVNVVDPGAAPRRYRTLLKLLEQPVVCTHYQRQKMPPAAVRGLTPKELVSHAERRLDTLTDKKKVVMGKNKQALHNLLSNKSYPFTYYRNGRGCDALGDPSGFLLIAKNVYDVLIGCPFISQQLYERVQTFNENTNKLLLEAVYSKQATEFLEKVVTNKPVVSQNVPSDAYLVGRVEHTPEISVSLLYSPDKNAYYLRVRRGKSQYACSCNAKNTNNYLQKKEGENALMDEIGQPWIRNDGNLSQMSIPKS